MALLSSIDLKRMRIIRLLKESNCDDQTAKCIARKAIKEHWEDSLIFTLCKDLGK